MMPTQKTMGWIRLLEKLKKGNASNVYIGEYEILSECHIGGVLAYAEDKIMCGGLVLDKTREGLYTYLLKVTHAGAELPNDEATKKGYHFKDGVIGEILVLFSLFFRCRFYLASTSHGELTSHGLKVKFPHDYLRIPCNPAIHPPIFSSAERNFAIGLDEFFDKVKNLPIEFHQQFILAGYHYLLALKEVGIDTEMVFVRLVSAIEALASNFIELDEKDDLLKNIDIQDVTKNLKISKEEVEELINIFSVRKSTLKFIKFIEIYSKGYFKGGNSNVKRLKILRKDLPKVLKTIYTARSNYLHNGEPMYLSRPMHGATKWDTDPTLGMVIDNRSFSESQKLPYAYWFEGLVRHCLLNFLNEKAKNN